MSRVKTELRQDQTAPITREAWSEYIANELRATREDPQKINLVLRFIETKSGSVRFTENEWKMAREIGERYFIYRVSFPSVRRDHAQLTIAKNPYAQSSAIRVAHELLIDQVASRETFDLAPADEDPFDDPLKGV